MLHHLLLFSAEGDVYTCGWGKHGRLGHGIDGMGGNITTVSKILQEGGRMTSAPSAQFAAQTGAASVKKASHARIGSGVRLADIPSTFYPQVVNAFRFGIGDSKPVSLVSEDEDEDQGISESDPVKIVRVFAGSEHSAALSGFFIIIIFWSLFSYLPWFVFRITSELIFFFIILKNELTEDGKLFTWGRGSSGQLGVGSCADQALPCLIEIESIRTICCSQTATFIIDGKLPLF